MKTILYVHPSTGMYGADKVLLSLVTGLDKKYFSPIVLLPNEGPLLNALREMNITTYIIPLVTISRATFSAMGLLKLPFNILRSIRAINRAIDKIQIDIVHSNTLGVLSGALWAKIKRKPHIWHVHEMIVHPKIVRHFFPWILSKLAFRVICNSHATRDLLLESQPRLDEKTAVIWNGIERSEPIDERAVTAFRQQLGLGDNDVLVALVGRINRWKGQGLLIEAADLMWEKGIRNIHYLMVGSPPHGQEHFKDTLLSQIDASPAWDRITVMDFRDDIWTIWDACDIGVVPSTEPEPFGLVALEAMTAGKPVVAAGHGGILDIVINETTGVLFEPGNPDNLAGVLEKLTSNKAKQTILGENGLKRYRNRFSLKSFISSFKALYESI